MNVYLFSFRYKDGEPLKGDLSHRMMLPGGELFFLKVRFILIFFSNLEAKCIYCLIAAEVV